jgi:hypothetical protein
MEIAMTTYRQERGPYLIEAGARDLGNGSHWQPWLRLTRRAGGVSARSTFDGLKPVFGTEQSALAYAAELGMSLADEGLMLGASGNQKPAARPQHEVSARAVHLSLPRANPDVCEAHIFGGSIKSILALLGLIKNALASKLGLAASYYA